MRAIEPFSFRTRLNNPIEQMWTAAIMDWGANGGANGGEWRRKEKEVKRKRGNEEEKGETESERRREGTFWEWSDLGWNEGERRKKKEANGERGNKVLQKL